MKQEPKIQKSIFESSHSEKVIILDFGSQYTQLIARRVREEKVYCEILPCHTEFGRIAAKNPKAIILSGGPASLTAKNSPVCDRRVFEMGVPVLGICYGMQLIGKFLGGKVAKSKKREYGHSVLKIDNHNKLFYGIEREIHVWMSHGDKIVKLPKGFKLLAHTPNSSIAAMGDLKRNIFGVQFHPEVVHTPKGSIILRNFLFKISGCSPIWSMKSFIKKSISNIRDFVGKEKVICALSGGVDSSVLAVLLSKAIGRQVNCIFVNNGLLRLNEPERVVKTFKKFNINLKYINAEERFLKKLKGVTDPEKKRKIIGNEFIKLFEEEAKKIGKVKFLAQGTLYPDVIESVSSFGGPSVTIKTHHNVGGLPKKMNLKLIESFRELFKDEVRLVGKELGLSDDVIYRQPFPGPGLAVRIVGDITKLRLRILKEADYIIIDEIKRADLYRKTWQAFGVLLPVKSVGIMGDERTYENVIALRAVTSLDGMTADWAKLPYEVLGRISNRIINEVKGVNRVVYDISSKPPSTIEWE